MSLRTCTCNPCKAKFNGNGPLVTQRTITSHLHKQQKSTEVPSTTKLIRRFGAIKDAALLTNVSINSSKCVVGPLPCLGGAFTYLIWIISSRFKHHTSHLKVNPSQFR
ncbi:hypothetical protein PSHT_13987 [Puccinia striiformis]|uniref:Uncharacterized protein n=1 Tax=Puccinia striiformis TaxID=27350 RepID=A0A2S4UML1_9BASI|nr:hypothetical protein PSHT_13987 [Puccinia striiformis]